INFFPSGFHSLANLPPQISGAVFRAKLQPPTLNSFPPKPFPLAGQGLFIFTVAGQQIVAGVALRNVVVHCEHVGQQTRRLLIGRLDHAVIESRLVDRNRALVNKVVQHTDGAISSTHSKELNDTLSKMPANECRMKEFKKGVIESATVVATLPA